MEGFTDHNVDGFDNFGGDDDNFLSASGRSRRTARKAVKAAGKQTRKTVKVTAKQDRKTTRVQGRVERKAKSPSDSRSISEEETTIYTDPSSTNVNIPGPDNEYPNMEAIRTIAESDEEDNQGNQGNHYGQDKQEEEDNADGFNDDQADGDDDNDNDNADGDDDQADGEELDLALSMIDDDNFLSAGGKRRARRDEKHKAKIEKKAAKTDIKKSRAEKKRAAGDAKQTRADAKMTKAEGRGGDTLLDKVKGGVNKLMGKGGESGGGDEGAEEAADTGVKKDVASTGGMSADMKKYLMYGGIGVVAVGLIFTVIKMSGPKKAA